MALTSMRTRVIVIHCTQCTMRQPHQLEPGRRENLPYRTLRCIVCLHANGYEFDVRATGK